MFVIEKGKQENGDEHNTLCRLAQLDSRSTA